MFAFIVKRLAMSVLVIFGVLVLTFLVTRVAPADPAALWAGPRATPQQKEQAARELGLDKPLYVQLGSYITDFFRGDFGRSLQTKEPVAQQLRAYLPATLELVVVAMIIAILIGLPLGLLSASKKDRLLDDASRVFAVGVVSMPAFWMALLLQLVFYRQLDILPLGGQLSDRVALLSPVQTITGVFLIDSLVTGNLVAFRDAFGHLILPALVLAGPALGGIQRMTRSAMVEILNEDYIVAARSYGLTERRILWLYSLKNSLGPTATVIALAAGYMLVNTFLVEAVFFWPGIGSYIATSVVVLDYPAILAVTVLSAIAYIILNTVADLVIALDPRVRTR